MGLQCGGFSYIRVLCNKECCCYIKVLEVKVSSFSGRLFSGTGVFGLTLAGLAAGC